MITKRTIWGPLFGSLALGLTACGDTTTEVTETNRAETTKVEAIEDLPKCTVKNEGEIVYVADSAALYYCANRKWAPLKKEESAEPEPGKAGTSCNIEPLGDNAGYKVLCRGDSVGVLLNGTDGNDGKDGKDGTDGENGADAGEAKNGSDGKSCTAKALEDGSGYIIVCDGDTVGTILNGSDGMDGKDASKSYIIDTRDNNMYGTVVVGSLMWMTENLRLDLENKFSEYKSLYGKGHCYGGDSKNCQKYGFMYSWNAIVDTAGIFSNDARDCAGKERCGFAEDAKVQGICPDGWRIPTKTDFENSFSRDIFNSSGGIEVMHSRLAEFLPSTEWEDCSYVGSDVEFKDIYGLKLLPGGYSTTLGDDSIEDVGLGCMLEILTLSEEPDNNNWSYYIEIGYEEHSPDLRFNTRPRTDAGYLRCVKDVE